METFSFYFNTPISMAQNGLWNELPEILLNNFLFKVYTYVVQMSKFKWHKLQDYSHMGHIRDRCYDF
jgi:hypothetical protein